MSDSMRKSANRSTAVFDHSLERSAKLADELCFVLAEHCGERGTSEGAVETLTRIVSERNLAVSVLAELVASVRVELGEHDEDNGPLTLGTGSLSDILGKSLASAEEALRSLGAKR